MGATRCLTDKCNGINASDLLMLIDLYLYGLQKVGYVGSQSKNDFYIK